jgi:hypothetical protein
MSIGYRATQAEPESVYETRALFTFLQHLNRSLLMAQVCSKAKAIHKDDLLHQGLFSVYNGIHRQPNPIILTFSLPRRTWFEAGFRE